MANRTNQKSQIAHRANLYLDNEMSLESEELFKVEMQRNVETRNIVIAEQQFKRFIKNSYVPQKAPENLVASIHQRIRQEEI